MAMDMELCITGPEPGKIDHTLYCHVMNLEEPLHLQSYYYLKCFRSWHGYGHGTMYHWSGTREDRSYPVLSCDEP